MQPWVSLAYVYFVNRAWQDFLLSKAARLDRALRSLPKADLKSLQACQVRKDGSAPEMRSHRLVGFDQAASHKKARKLLRSLSYPARPQAGTSRSQGEDLGPKS